MKNRFVQIVRTAAWFVLLIAIVIAVFYALRVYRARQITSERIGSVLASESMVLDPSDLDDERLGILLTLQDPGFFSHRGTDFSGGTMTTITQALAKVYYFDAFKPGLRKIEQSLIARYALDALVSKEDQLRLFLNVAYLGTIEGKEVLGFSDGARVYYDKSFDDLDRREFIALVAMLAGPNRLDPIRHPEASARRVAQIEQLLAGECDRGGLLGGGDC